MPERIQRRRTKGWRLPQGAVIVSRPSTFGNPFAIGAVAHRRRLGCIEQIVVTGPGHAVQLYREWIANPHTSFITGLATVHPTLVVDRLRGHDLCCWCALDQPCHADVLLELANQEGA